MGNKGGWGVGTLKKISGDPYCWGWKRDKTLLNINC